MRISEQTSQLFCTIWGISVLISFAFIVPSTVLAFFSKSAKIVNKISLSMLWLTIPLLILLWLSYNPSDDDMKELGLLAFYATCLPAVLSLIAFFASREKLASIKSGSPFSFWSPTTIYSMAILLCVVGISFLAYQNFWLKKTVDRLANQAGAAQAVSEFKRGRLIIWEMVETNDTPKFSGLYDGPFEIWYDESHSAPAAWIYGQRRLNEAHNKQMRLMQLHPERFGVEMGATGSQSRNLNVTNSATTRAAEN